MPFRPSELLSYKICLLLIPIFVLLLSITAYVPNVNAAIQRDYGSTEDNPITSGYPGHTKVCGIHLCSSSQKDSWSKTVWGSQSKSQGKITSTKQHGEDVMSKLAGSTSGPTTAHGSVKPTIHTTMPVIGATKNANMTGKGPNNK